jgi:lysine-N-methylase
MARRASMTRTISIHLPLFQRFDCHHCGYCCRNLVVNVTPEDRQRIISAGWAERLPGEILFETYRFLGRRHHRLAHNAEGVCVFLNAEGLCRLHAETGSETKPLACRLYPFVPTPGVEDVRIDLRGDCPSVAANKGRSLTVHQEEITRLASEVGARPMLRPPLWRGERVPTPVEFVTLVSAFEAVLRQEDLPVRTRLRAGSRLLDLLYGVRIAKVHGDRFSELVSLLADASIEDARKASAGELTGGSPRAHKLFRQWLFLHALADDPKDLDIGFVGRRIRSWRRYQEARRFAAGAGPVPLLRPEWPSTDFETVLGVARGPDEILEPVCRALRLKLDAHAFAGPGYFGYDLLSGLTALWLMPAVVGWFARLQVVAAGSKILTAEAVLEGLRQTHHTFGVSPVFSRISERFRLRALSHPEIPAAILARYGP